MAPDAIAEELAAGLGSRVEARWVLADLAGLDPAARKAAAASVLEGRRRGEPLQYLLGHWQFRTLDLLVDGRALIPRPETEMMVDRALAALVARRGELCAADLGCGTGAVALSLAVEADALRLELDVVATDLSEGALELARANAVRTRAPRVTFEQGSWFEALDPALRGRLSVVCSNPPYVAAAVRGSLDAELDYEPALALVADDAEDGTPGFGAVATILESVSEWLADGGTVLVEHGDDQGDAAVAAARASGLVDIVDHVDLAGRPRLLEARRRR